MIFKPLLLDTGHDDEVGYGDFVPKSVGGYIIACLVAD